MDVPLKEMVNHACQDADMALRLYPILVDELKQKRIATQYWNRTIPLAQRLGDLEFEGLSVNVRRIEKMRNARLERAERVKNDLCRQARRAFDPDSQIELAAVLRDVAGVRSRIGASATRMSVLEQLAASEPTVRLIVQYKRLRKEIAALESIVDATTGKKVYPLFSQIRYPCGIVATAKPSLFDVGTSRELRSCFGRSVHAFIRDADRSVDVLAEATGDPVLGRARAGEPKGDQLLWSHELMKGLDYNALLLSCAIGYEDSVLSGMFLIDHLTISRIRHDVRRTYPIVFRWIQGYQRRAEKSGYAASDCRRKYIAGLRSSSIAKRKRAREEVVSTTTLLLGPLTFGQFAQFEAAGL